MELAALFISLGAFCLSAYVAWVSALRPAKLNVRFNFVGVGLAGSDKKAVLVVPLSIFNYGAQPAVVIDSLLLERDETRVAIFTSWASIKPETIEGFFRDKRDPQQASPYVEGMKTAFLVPPRSQVLKAIVFQPYQTWPLLEDEKSLQYEVILRTADREWRASSTVRWPSGTKNSVGVHGAVLMEVEDGLLWGNSVAQSNGIDLNDSRTIGNFDY